MPRTLVMIPGMLLALASACSGGNSGPSGPSLPSVSGVYTGTNSIVTNTCTGETGTFLDPRSVSVTQTGSSIRITLAGLVLMGTIQPAGSFTATGSTMIEGVHMSITMQGSITGNRLIATQRADLSVPGDSCVLTMSFNMTREN